MIVYLLGGESVSHVNSITKTDPPLDRFGISVSWSGLKKRRSTAAHLHRLADRGLNLALDAGYSNVPLEKETAEGLRDQYYDFVESVHLPSLVVIDFDHQHAPGDCRESDGRVVPVVRDPDPDLVVAALEMKNRFAMSVNSGSDRRLPAVIRKYKDENSLAIKMGGIEISNALDEGYNAILTSAWTGPAKYGYYVVWDGATFHPRIHDAEEMQGYAEFLSDNGFSMEKLLSKDSAEGNSLAAWSMVKWAEHLSMAHTGSAKTATAEVVSLHDRLRTSAKSISASESSSGAPRRSLAMFPGFGTSTTDGFEEGPSGNTTYRSREVLSSTGESPRMCDSCFLARTCPSFEVGASCAYHFPVEVRTESQLKAVLATMVEVQAGRVAFAKFAEDMNGGFPDPVVGQEMDRLVRIADRIRKSEEKRERLTVSVEAESSGGSGAGGGVFSTIFGNRAVSSDRPRQVEETALPINELEPQDISDT